MTTYIHSPVRNALRSPVRAPNIWEWYVNSTAPSAWETLLDSLQTETDGLVLYFTDPDYPRALIRETYTASGELVTNGTFDTDTTGWTATAGTMAIVSGQLELTNSGAASAYASQSFATVVGALYTVSATLVNGTAAARLRVGTSENDTTYASFTSSNTATFVATTTTTWITLRSGSSTATQTCLFDNITCQRVDRSFDGDANSNLTYTSPSLKNVMGADGTIKYANHNLCLQSQTFDNASWDKSFQGSASAPTVTANAGTAPDGTSTADRIQFSRSGTAVTDRSRTQQNITIAANSNVAFTVWLKSYDGADQTVTVFPNWGSGSASAVTVTSTWQRFSVSANMLSGTTATPVFGLGYVANSVVSADVLAWGAEVKVTPVHDAGTLSDYVPTTTAAKYRLPIEYDTAGDPVGLRRERASTNLALRSDDLTNASWTKSNMTTAKTATGPDGVANSATTCTATAGNATALQAITSSSAARITSTYIKRRTGTGNIDLTQDNGSTWTTVTVTSSWTRVNTASATAADPTVGIRIVTSGDAVDIALFQHELGAAPTSSIRTVAATVTRAADQIGLATSTFPWSATNGYFVAKAKPILAASLGGIVSVNDGTGNEEIVLYVDASGNLVYQVEDGGANQLAPLDSAVNAANNTSFTMAAAYKANDFAVSVGGAAVTTDTNGTLPTVATLEIGANQANDYFDGWFEWIKYVPRDVSDANLVSESAL